MSQLVAYLSREFLFLASDRRVLVGEGSSARVHTVPKLFTLGTQAAVATCGAGVGVAASRTLARLLRKAPAMPLSELEAYALSVFQKTYDEFIRNGQDWFAAHPEAYRLSYILLGGRQPDGALGFRFYASEHHGESYRPLPCGNLLTAPRRLGLEHRLSQAASSGASAEDVRGAIVAGLRLIARGEGAVAGPFDTALVDARGARIETAEA